jgi:hypothetical protein
MEFFVDEQFRNGSFRPSQNSMETMTSISGASSVEASSSHGFGLPAVAAPAVEEDQEMEDISHDDKENVPLSQLDNSARANLAVVASADYPQQRAVLMDIELQVPPEIQEHPYSDVEESDEDGDEQEEVYNLADALAERVNQNVDGRYDFEIFCDP